MDVFLTTEALRTTECTEKNSEISVFSVVFSDSERKKGTTDFTD
jgi:hypothetical protein